jgi:hypothetical protein
MDPGAGRRDPAHREVPDAARRLPPQDNNTAPQVQACFDYQYECTAWWVLERLRSPEFLGIMVEHSTDLIVLTTSGPPELVSIKHRQLRQSGTVGWSQTALKKDRVLLDLYDRWVEAGRQATVAFVSDVGCSGAAAVVEKACTIDRGDARTEGKAKRILASMLQIPAVDAGQFLDSLNMLRDHMPARSHISDGNWSGRRGVITRLQVARVGPR